jgi:hypothetical protein
MLPCLAFITAAACGTNGAAGHADAPADRDGGAPHAVLAPGVYRARARGRDVYGAVFPAAGVLRVEHLERGRQNVTLTLPEGPGGVRTGAYEGIVEIRGDTARTAMLCRRCRIQAQFGEAYADLDHNGDFLARSLGGGRVELREVRYPSDPRPAFVDTLTPVAP